MPKEQSSEKMSTLASIILKLKPFDETVKRGPTYVELRKMYNDLLDKAQSVSGSVLSQDEIPE